MSTEESFLDSVMSSEPEVDLEAGTIDGKAVEEASNESFEEFDTGTQDADPSPSPVDTGEEGGETPPPTDEGQGGDDAGDAHTGEQQVPLAALKEERTKRQHLEGEIQQMKAQLAQMQQPAQPEGPVVEPLESRLEKLGSMPDAEMDPEAHAQWERNRQQAEIDYLKETQEYTQRVESERRQAEEFDRAAVTMHDNLRTQEQSFADEHPDYYDALEFARSKTVEELRSKGVAGSDQQLRAMVEQREMMTSFQMMMNGINPVQATYEAIKGMGYQPKASGENAGDAQANADKLRKVAEGQAVNKDLGSGGKAADVGEPQDEDDDFAAAQKQAFGGLDFNVPII